MQRIIMDAGGKTPDDGWHWFDHPEMQARIGEAEADRREGRAKVFSSREDALAYLDTLA